METTNDEKYKREYALKRYVTEFNQRAFTRQHFANDWQTWIDLYVQMVEWELRLSEIDEAYELQETHQMERRECNVQFADYVEAHYQDWIIGSNSPPLSVDLLSKYVFPQLQGGNSVFFLLLDCLRLDHWLVIEPILNTMFNVKTYYYYSILPTATNYARNSIFSGLFPMEFAERYPDMWAETDSASTSVNRHERELLMLQLQRHGLNLKPNPHYYKIFDRRGELEYLQWVNGINHISFLNLVVDVIDIFTHKRSEVKILEHMLPDEITFRLFIKLWFEHSTIFKILKIMAARGVTVVLTSDHGSIRCTHPSKVFSGKSLNNGMRYKFGSNLKTEDSTAIRISSPENYMLPDDLPDKTYLIAKDDYFFVYNNNYHTYKNQLSGGFQHGGLSMEEMILPCVLLEP